MPKSQTLPNQKEKNEEQINDITFAPNKWLNDREVEWILEEEVKKRSPKKHGFVSVYDWPLVKAGTDFDAMARLFSQLVEHDNELVFIPVINPETHWSLLVYETKSNKFYHLDSSKQKLNREYVKDLVDHLCQHKDATFEDIDNRPLQPNADDCGIYLLTFTKLLSKNPELLRDGIPEIDAEKERGYWQAKAQSASKKSAQEPKKKYQQQEAKIEKHKEDPFLNQLQGFLKSNPNFSSKSSDLFTEESESNKEKENEKESLSTSTLLDNVDLPVSEAADISFTPELQKKWEEKGIDYEEAEEWIEAGLKVDEVDYCAWLRNEKELEPVDILDYEYEEELRREYKKSMKKSATVEEKNDQNYKKDIEELKNQLTELSNLVFPYQNYDFIALKRETKRLLKIQDLSCQVSTKKKETEKLISSAKEKFSKSEKCLLEKLFKKHDKVIRNSVSSSSQKLEELKENLGKKLVEKEVQTLLAKQAEIIELEKQLDLLLQEQNLQPQIEIPPK